MSDSNHARHPCSQRAHKHAIGHPCPSSGALLAVPRSHLAKRSLFCVSNLACGSSHLFLSEIFRLSAVDKPPLPQKSLQASTDYESLTSKGRNNALHAFVWLLQVMLGDHTNKMAQYAPSLRLNLMISLESSFHETAVARIPSFRQVHHSVYVSHSSSTIQHHFNLSVAPSRFQSDGYVNDEYIHPPIDDIVERQ